MSSEWPLVEISTICEGIFDGPHATPQKTEQGPIFLGISSLNKGRLDLSKLEYLSEDDFKKWTKRITPKAGDLVFSYETRLGEVAMIPEGLRCCLGRRMALMRINQEKAIPEYVLYAYLSPLFQDVIRARTIHGSTVDRIPLMEFGTFPIHVPPLDVQSSIASILKALDDRIALLRETNATLEAIAQALFKSWFVDFDPVHANAGTQAPNLPPEIQALFPATFTDNPQGLIPEGWSYVNLGELVCNQSTTFRFHGIDKVVFINTGDVSEGLFLHQDYVSTDGLPGQAKKAIQRDDILFSEIRPKNKRFAYVNLDPKDYVVSTKFMVLRAILDISPRYIYQILKQDETIDFFNMIAESRSGTFPQITFDSIQTYQVLKPSKACVDKFIDLVSPIIEQIDLTSERQKELSNLRDTLLPRLISGQLRLPEAEQAIATITD